MATQDLTVSASHSSRGGGKAGSSSGTSCRGLGRLRRNRLVAMETLWRVVRL